MCLVAIIGYDEANILDISGSLQVFTAANEILISMKQSKFYDACVCSLDGRAIRTSSGVWMQTQPLPLSTSIHTVIIGGAPGKQFVADNRDLVEWLARNAASVERIASVCTGAFLLAEAKLLEDRRATTHWSRCDDLGFHYPRIKVERDPIFVCDGKIWTSAGITAGIDLALAMVERDVDHALALEVARHLVVFLKRSGGQAQFSSLLSLQKSTSGFSELHDWIGGHLSGHLSVSVLAEKAGMSERTFARRYKKEVGKTPAVAVEMIRLEAARQLLQNGSLSLKSIAAHCGFGSDENFRRSFLKFFAISPRSYRKRFGILSDES